MVARYTSSTAVLNATGEFVLATDYITATDRIAELEGVLQVLISRATQALPALVKTADEQTVSDFILTLAKKTK